jgi:hypothetical protein
MSWGRRKTGWGDDAEGEGEARYSFNVSGIIKTILEVVPGGVIRAGKTTYADDAHVGFWLGVDHDGLAKLNLGGKTFYLKWTGSELLIAADGSGLTSIDGGKIQTGTITADALSVTNLAAVSANLGSVVVDEEVVIDGADGKVVGVVDEVAQWWLSQYGLDFLVTDDAQVIRFVDGNGVEVGRIDFSKWGGDGLLRIDAKPLAASGDTEVVISSQSFDASHNALLSQLTLQAVYNGAPTATVTLIEKSNTVGLLRLINNTVGTPAAWRGVGVGFYAEDSTTPSEEIGRLEFTWANITHASRKGQFMLYLKDASGDRVVLAARLDPSLPTLDAPEGLAVNSDMITLSADGTATFKQGDVWIDSLANVGTSGAFYVDYEQVVGNRQAAISAPSGGSTVDAEARTAIGSILAALRTHGLIAS